MDMLYDTFEVSIPKTEITILRQVKGKRNPAETVEVDLYRKNIDEKSAYLKRVVMQMTTRHQKRTCIRPDI